MYYSELQLSALQEIGNIGAGNAATALSELVHTVLHIAVPNVQLIPFKDVSEQVGGGDAVVIAVMFQLAGDLDGMMYWILPLASAQTLVRSFFAPAEQDLSYDMAQSMIQEVGNILSGAYLSAVCDFTKLQVLPSPPAMAEDMADALLADGMIYVADEQDAVILIETDLQAQNSGLCGYFFIMLRPESLQKLLSALGV